MTPTYLAVLAVVCALLAVAVWCTSLGPTWLAVAAYAAAGVVAIAGGARYTQRRL